MVSAILLHIMASACTVWANDDMAADVSTADVHVEADAAKEDAKMESQSTTIITAEDIAKKIGNNEFLLFTYIKHSAYLKADVTITGEEKESAISDLDKKIKELSESMGVNKQE